MESANFLKVNEPNVVHETIDGETILLDLNTGNYFSLAGPGAIIWEAIVETGSCKMVVDAFQNHDGESKETIHDAIVEFIGDLMKENLLVEATEAKADHFSTEITNQIRDAAKEFEAPAVNKYSDMQDLLLLDPIHEVDEKGWPESKDVPENL